jgi:hypothetical protein
MLSSFGAKLMLARVKLKPFGTACVSLAAMYAAGLHAQPSEFELKATILYKAARFIVWPRQTFESTEGTLTLCVVGPDRVAKAMAELEGKFLQNQRIVTRQINDINFEARQCHILFASQPLGLEAGLARISNLPVLTAGDVDHFVKLGGMLGLKLTDNKVRFEVNLNAFREAGLDVSPQLLQLSTVVSASATEQ